nr:NUDIX domain-containing protein [uncultured Rhodoferax sp.]
MQHRLSAGIIVESEGTILLVRSVLPGRYDFWVAPGGGIQGTEELREAAKREVREECGLEVDAERLLYIEEMYQPDLRICKFWFTGRLIGGALSVSGPEAVTEHITEAAWLSRESIQGKTVYPSVLASRYWDDKNASSAAPIHLGLRAMESW